MSPVQLLSFLLMLLASVYVRAQPVPADYDALGDYDAAMAQLRKDLVLTNYKMPEKRWANQVRFGKRGANSWASSVRFG